MSTFARFLVESSLASENAVLEALIGQVETQPPLCSIVWRAKLLAPSEQLRVLEYQATSGCGYLDALKQLNLWQEPLIGRLSSLVDEATTPLAELLLRSGATNLSAINRAFDEFVCQGAAERRSTHLDRELDANATTTDASAAVAEVRYDHGINQEFIELFNDERRNRIRSAISAWRTSRSREGLIHVASEWESLRVGSRFVGAHSIEDLLSLAILALRNLAVSDDSPNDAAVEEMIEDITDLCWNMVRHPDKVSVGDIDSRILSIKSKVRALIEAQTHKGGQIK